MEQALGGTIGTAAAISTPAGSWFGASGLASLRTGFAVQLDDLFQIGSITKPFVAPPSYRANFAQTQLFHPLLSNVLFQTHARNN